MFDVSPKNDIVKRIFLAVQFLRIARYFIMSLQITDRIDRMTGGNGEPDWEAVTNPSQHIFIAKACLQHEYGLKMQKWHN